MRGAAEDTSPFFPASTRWFLTHMQHLEPDNSAACDPSSTARTVITRALCGATRLRKRDFAERDYASLESGRATSGARLVQHWDIPEPIQAQTLQRLCLALNTRPVSGRYLFPIHPPIPFSKEPIIRCPCDGVSERNSLRRLVQDFALKLTKRTEQYARPWKVSRRVNDADYGYSLLSLTVHGETFRRFSTAYRTLDFGILPLEINIIITDILLQLPEFETGESAARNRKQTIRGVVENVSGLTYPPRRFACCFPSLGGYNRVFITKRIEVSSTTKQALEYFGHGGRLADLYGQVLTRFSDDFPTFSEHDTLLAIAIFTCALLCYEYYLRGSETGTTMARVSTREKKRRHLSLMNTRHAYPAAPRSRNRPNSDESQRVQTTPQNQPAQKRALTNANKEPVELPKDDPETDNNAESDLYADTLPESSCSTFISCRLPEQDLLDRLAKLEQEGKLYCGKSSIGKSVYRSAIEFEDTTSLRNVSRKGSCIRLAAPRPASQDVLRGAWLEFAQRQQAGKGVQASDLQDGLNTALLEKASITTEFDSFRSSMEQNAGGVTGR